MDWEKLKTFQTAADSGSLTAASEKLSLSQSAVSRQIGALEDDIGMPLFHRHARGLMLTEQGHILRETTRGIADKVALAQSRLRDSREMPFGPLHITSTVAMGSIWLTPRIVEFIRDYPQIVPSLILTDQQLDLARLEADCALRLWRPTQPDLVQRQLFTVGQSLYASRDYISTRGAPRSIGELADHPIILFGASGDLRDVDWLATYERDDDDPLKPALILDSIYGVMKAVQSGAGIASLPNYVASDNKQLVRILPEVCGPEFAVYFVYPEELRRSKRITAFSDFLTRQTRKWQNENKQIRG